MATPDLRDLEAFANVARAKSFRKAAREMGLSVSGLSQRLRDLEELLGMRLLNRTTRSVSPTEAGEELLERLWPALDAMRAAVVDVQDRRDRPAGRLKINAPPPAVQFVLAPMVAPFLKQYPDIELLVEADSVRIDIVAAGFDAGVRYEEHLAQDMIAVPLGGPESYAIAAAPALLERFGVPQVPEDLANAPAVLMRFPNGASTGWEFEKDGRVLRMSPKAQLQSSLPQLLVQAAIDGVGFLMASEHYMREAIAAGRLVCVLEDWCPPFTGPFLYYPSRRQPPPALAAFIAFVKAWRARQA